MIKKIRTWWQGWLDGSTEPLFEPEEVQESSAQPAFFSGPYTPRAAAFQQHLGADHHTVRLALRELHQEQTMEMAAMDPAELPPGAPAQAYEAEMGPITAQLLRELEETYIALRDEKMRAVSDRFAQERRERQARAFEEQERKTWTQVMVERRSQRNQQRAQVDVEHLFRDDIPEDERRELVCAGIRARALHASDPEAPTGLIPLTYDVLPGLQEEDTA
jgi:hypothetical protein